MHARWLLLSTILLPLAGEIAAPQVAFAGDVEAIGKALARQPFRDLPGVRTPQKLDDGPESVCTSSIERPEWGETRGRLGKRVYRCDIDENITVKSTLRPDEVDWKKQKRYYKPWIDDGFDR